MQFFVIKEEHRRKYVCTGDKVQMFLQNRKENLEAAKPPNMYLSKDMKKADILTYSEARAVRLWVHEIVFKRKWKGVFKFNVKKVDLI